ncbi:universal stress protein PHOS32 [Fagus crenata]
MARTHRKIGIVVDLNDESAFAVRWAVQNYLRPGDAVILLHVHPMSVLYSADWGANEPLMFPFTKLSRNSHSRN